MIIKWFLMFFTLYRIVSAINADSVLTPEENHERKEQCLKFVEKQFRIETYFSEWNGSWLYKINCLTYFLTVSAISQKHVVASSIGVLHYNQGSHWWRHNESLFDREAYCKSGMRYLELSTDVIKIFEKNGQSVVLQGYILGICDQSAAHYPMVLVTSTSHGQFACIADENTSKFLKTDVYVYEYYESYEKVHPIPAVIMSRTESSIVLKIPKIGQYHGPIVTVFVDRVTLLGVIPYKYYDALTVEVTLIPFEFLCTFFGICKKESTVATITSGSFTNISTANMTHSSSTDDATTSSVTPGHDYNSASHTDDAIDLENSTTSSVTPQLDYNSASHTDDATVRENTTTSSVTPEEEYSSASHTDDVTVRENTTNSLFIPGLGYNSASHKNDPSDRGNSTTSSVIVVTQVTDFTDEIDVAYDEFMADYEKMMKKEYEEGKAKDGSGGNKLLSIELCVLILTAHCLIY